MRILVMGAGAIGAYFGARLQQSGEDVVFCARGENLRALKERGLEIKSVHGDLALKVRATGRPADFAPYDLILFCVKAYDTEAAAAAIRRCLAPGGAILTVQNGIENEARLVELFGKEAVMGGNSRAGVELVAPGKVVHITHGIIEFGELDGVETPRARAVAETFRRAGILGALTPNLRAIRWQKLMGNASVNTVCALTRSSMGPILEDPDGRALLRRLMHEVLEVARAEGADLDDRLADEYLAMADQRLKAVRPSTLQDLERGKPLEYEALAGAPLRAARRHGMAVPALETIYTLLKLLDRRPR